MASPQTTYEHPLDVLNILSAWQAEQACALVTITHTSGGAVRAVGALFAVGKDGRSAGYISGGCIDADVVLQAQHAIEAGQARQVRYGAGSPFVDLPLPCGGAIDVLILPNPDRDIISAMAIALSQRQSIRVRYDEDGIWPLAAGDYAENALYYEPKLRLRIAGRGTDCLALARIGAAAGFEIHLQVRDDDDMATAMRGELDVSLLASPNDLPTLDDDAWTAFVLMFHDRDWDGALLQQALRGPAFYIGAVGSRRTQALRSEALREAGLSDMQITRICGPIGLVPSLRDASSLAISTLAEVIESFQQRLNRAARKTALVVLAAGSASRFEGEDKLLATLSGAPLLAHVAALSDSLPFHSCVGVVGPDHDARADLLRGAGWKIVRNLDAATGQASSIRNAIAAIEADPTIQQVLILLGDMPAIMASDLEHVLLTATPDLDAVMSQSAGTLMPPSLFTRKHFPELKALSGDRGARVVFKGLERTAVIPISGRAAIDIDTKGDLARVTEVMDG